MFVISTNVNMSDKFIIIVSYSNYKSLCVVQLDSDAYQPNVINIYVQNIPFTCFWGTVILIDKRPFTLCRV